MMNRAALILNVDDHEPARYARGRMLERAGYQVLSASSGENALAIAHASPIDVVILDINLPDISGFEVSRRLRAETTTSSIPILQITASSLTVESHVRALEMGADTYLVEPVDPGVLVATVKALLRMRAAEERMRRANTELQRSNAELQEFAWVASHDLKEPLRTITAYSQLLARRFSGQLGTDGDDYINFIVAATRRMGSLIEDLLAWSQVGSQVERVEVDMEAALARVTSTLHEAIRASEATIEHGPLPVVRGWPDQIEQLLQNLVSNSIKYRRLDTPVRISITADRERSGWCFSVQDNGMGFEPRYAEQIFGLFKRLDVNYPGTGIGLAIARKIVERHGGRIWATSTPGVGSTFSFTIADATDGAAF